MMCQGCQGRDSDAKLQELQLFTPPAIFKHKQSV